MNPDDIYSPLYADLDYYIDHLDEQDAMYEKINALPQKIQDVIYGGSDTIQKMKNVCNQFSLTQTQVKILSILTRKILIAEVFIGNLIPELQKQLDLPESKARGLADALTSELFAPAITELKELHAKTFGNQQSKPTSNVVNLRTSKSTN